MITVDITDMRITNGAFDKSGNLFLCAPLSNLIALSFPSLAKGAVRFFV